MRVPLNVVRKLSWFTFQFEEENENCSIMLTLIHCFINHTNVLNSLHCMCIREQSIIGVCVDSYLFPQL